MGRTVSDDASVVLIRALIENMRGAGGDWESVALVLDLTEGYFVGASGYAYGPDGTEAIASDPLAVRPAADGYLASKYPPGDPLPVKLLVQLDRTSGRYAVDFEDTDVDRWKVSPKTIRTIREELRPRLGAAQEPSTQTEGTQ